MSADRRRALVALQQTTMGQQQRDAAALQHAETRLVSLRNAHDEARRHRDRVRGVMDRLGAPATANAQPLDRVWARRLRLQRAGDALAAAERALASAAARVIEAARRRDALQQSITVAVARRTAAEASLQGATASTDPDPDD